MVMQCNAGQTASALHTYESRLWIIYKYGVEHEKKEIQGHPDVSSAKALFGSIIKGQLITQMKCIIETTGSILALIYVLNRGSFNDNHI